MKEERHLTHEEEQAVNAAKQHDEEYKRGCGMCEYLRRKEARYDQRRVR